uniref:Uncharacterized protein n=1 Tax=Picea sitchensis TaxID=3332 RepID=A9NYF6_PICSI|nr:unknown [Picea sitchensis]ABK27048.1 unknown [Picea sitchensis]
MAFFTTHSYFARSVNSGAVTLQICSHGTGDMDLIIPVTKIWMWVYVWLGC